MVHALISDNGSNFIGENKVLLRNFKNMVDEAQETLAANNINWKFIPSGSPYFGSICETAVKSMKRHLLKTIGSHVLNVEEMYMVLAKIKVCIRGL